MSIRRAAAVVALLLLLAACGEGGTSSEAIRESAGQVGAVDATTTTTTPGQTTTTGAVPTSTTLGQTSTTSPPTTRRVTTTAPRAPTTTAPPAPRPFTPPAPGTYRYDTSGTSIFAGNTLPFPGVTTLVVDPPIGARQRSTRDLRDGARNGLATEYILDYRSEGVFLVGLRLITGFSGVTDTRDLRPASPVLLLATNARPGAHLEADLGGTSTAKLVVDVLREERVTVAGQPVDTLAVRAVVALAPGDVTGRQELTINVDRGSRLWVRERSIADASAAGGLFNLHSEYSATLQRLTP